MRRIGMQTAPTRTSGVLRPRRRSLALAGAAALAVPLALVPVGDLLPAGAQPVARASAARPAAESSTGVPVHATGASAGARSDIAWVSWGTEGAPVESEDPVDPSSVTTVTNRHAMGDGARLEVTCTLDKLQGDDVVAYRPGTVTWGGDTPGSSTAGLGLLYPGMPPAGLRHAAGSDNGFSRFAVSCAAAVVTSTGDRHDVALGGLVLAEAESLNVGPNPQGQTVQEYVQATAATPQGTQRTPWRVVDTYDGRCADRENTATATVWDGTWSGARHWTVRLHNTQTQCAAGSATAVLLAQDVQRLEVEMQGQGYSAFAVGYVLGVDHGDAPEGYGSAGAVVAPTWDGGLVDTWMPLAGYVSGRPVDAAVAVRGAPEVTLGADAVADVTLPASADAAGDQPDEEALTGGAGPAAVDVERVVGAAYTSPEVVCRRGYVRGWVDWDRDGAFDADEASQTVDCTDATAASRTVVLTWPQVPADATGGTSFLRLRTSSREADLASATGPAVAGETEDWTIELIGLEVTKRADTAYVTAGPWTVRYTITVRNTGAVAFPEPVHVVDVLGGLVEGESVARVELPTSWRQVADDPLVWSGPLGAGETVELTYELNRTEALHAAAGVIRNTALVTSTAPDLLGPVTCTGTAAEEAGRCATLDVHRVGLTVEKTADADGRPLADGASLAPGTTVRWSYVVTNTGSLPVRGLVVSDLVTESRDGEPLVTGAAVDLDCGAGLTGATVTVPELAAGASVTCTATRDVVPRP